MTQRLRIVVDGRPLVAKRTGIGVHTAEICARLDVDPPPLVASHAEVADRSGIEHLRFAVAPARLGVVWQQTTLHRIAEREGEVLWGPHGTLPLRLRRPSVATIHDLTSLTMPLRHRIKTLASFNLLIGRSIAMATRITAVSRATAHEVMRGFGVSPERITIVPNGVSDFFSPADATSELPFGLSPQSYFLFVGTIEPRKGVGDLVAAWSDLPSPRPRLVICGDLGWRNADVLRAIEHHPAREEIIVSGYVDRRQLRELYRAALAFVYPSHYEGFGLPPLEAMACGTPVITSTAGALPEVTGDAALAVAPGDRASLARAMRRLMEAHPLRAELASAGLERARGFSWERSAALMLEVLSSAAGR